MNNLRTKIWSDWTLPALRWAAALQVTLVLRQAVLASQLLTGNAAARAYHHRSAPRVITWVGLIALVLAVLAWRPGRPSAWRTGPTGLGFIALTLQIGYGLAGRLAIHIPLGRSPPTTIGWLGNQEARTHFASSTSGVDLRHLSDRVTQTLPTQRQPERNDMTRTLIIALLTIATVACVAGPERQPQGPIGDNTVTLIDSRFTPADISVEAGTEVTWIWDDGKSHNVVGEGFASDSQTRGTFTHTFTEPGTYEYVCTLHRGMEGTVTVTESAT